MKDSIQTQPQNGANPTQNPRSVNPALRNPSFPQDRGVDQNRTDIHEAGQTEDDDSMDADEDPVITHRNDSEWEVPGQDTAPGVESPENDVNIENPTRRWL